MRPARAYRVLLERYGPQGWWPVTPLGGLRPVYRPGRRCRPTEREAVEVAVGAILTQNTAWTNVERALETLHRDGPLTLERLRRLPRRRLERLIRSSGYFRQKAVRLKEFAREAALRGGRLRRWLAGPLEARREELLAVRGIGPETADSILLYAGGRDAFVIDAYTLRIGSRIGWFPAGTRYGQARALLWRALAPLGRGETGRDAIGIAAREQGRTRLAAVFQEFHALLVRLAKLHCRTLPLCRACPLQEGCQHGRG